VAVLMRALKESPYFDQVDLQGTELGSSKEGLKTVKFNVDAVVVAPKPAKSAKPEARPARPAPAAGEPS
jgi:hypothetical protein